MRKVDTLKIMLMVLWETGSFKDKQYIALSEKVTGIGKMLGGWNGQLVKASSAKASQATQNSPSHKPGEK